MQVKLERNSGDSSHVRPSPGLSVFTDRILEENKNNIKSQFFTSMSKSPNLLSRNRGFFLALPNKNFLLFFCLPDWVLRKPTAILEILMMSKLADIFTSKISFLKCRDLLVKSVFFSR